VCEGVSPCSERSLSSDYVLLVVYAVISFLKTEKQTSLRSYSLPE
jgi:hypothetical protein